MLPRWQELLLPALASACLLPCCNSTPQGLSVSAPRRHPDCLFHLQPRAPWLGEAATGLRAEGVQGDAATLDVGTGPPFQSPSVCPGGLSACPFPPAGCQSVCLCGSEAQGWSGSPHPAPSPPPGPCSLAEMALPLPPQSLAVPASGNADGPGSLWRAGQDT